MAKTSVLPVTAKNKSVDHIFTFLPIKNGFDVIARGGKVFDLILCSIFFYIVPFYSVISACSKNQLVMMVTPSPHQDISLSNTSLLLNFSAQ